MGITVSDIEQKEFTFKGNGYDPYDVDQYLDQICDEMVAMQDRIDELQRELERAKADAKNAAEAVQPMPQQVVKAPAEPEAVSKTSEMLENILRNAELVSQQEIDKAKLQAASIVKEAEKKASDMLGSLREQKSTLEKEVATAKQTADSFKGRFLKLLDEQKELLESDDLFTK